MRWNQHKLRIQKKAHKPNSNYKIIPQEKKKV